MPWLSLMPAFALSRAPPAEIPSPAHPLSHAPYTHSQLTGFTQSGALFRAKTRALEKLLAKTLAPINLLPVLIFPTGPLRLRASEIPGYQPPTDAAGAAEDESDNWAWFRKDEASGQYRGFAEGMAAVAAAVRDAGGVQGCCGFSQGGCVAGVVAAAMQEDRTVPAGAEWDWARGLREANGGRQLRFAVSYSGFYAPVDLLKFCYDPKITTPTLHYYGSLDTVVDENRSRALIDSCVDPAVVVHPGGHHVPVSKEFVMPLAGFIKQYAQGEDAPKAGL